MPASPNAPLCAAPDPAPKSPANAIPRGACDAHMHICGPESRYTYSAERIYTPPDALLPSYLHLMERLRLERVVFVQPSVYGTDNTAMLDAMRECPHDCRGIAVVTADIGEPELEALHAAGIRGVRLNIVDTQSAEPILPQREIVNLAAKIAALGWHLELLAHVDDFPSLASLLRGLPVDVVFGHLGYCRRGASVDALGFQALLRLLETGRCWVKLTGPYRLTDVELPYSPVAAFAEALLRAAPERLVWGSDWPHVMLRGAMPNDAELLDLLYEWTGSADAAQRILVDNAAALYDFQSDLTASQGSR
jgi:2-pyrone-4,6-dicarboxylate lactonase